MGDGTKDLRIEPGIASHLLGIHLVALTIAVRDCPQLAHVGHDDFMAEFPNLFTNPDGMRPSLEPDISNGREHDISKERLQTELT